MNGPTTQEWIEALELCQTQKWNALAEGKEPETYECAACDLLERHSKAGCDRCVLSVDDGCCDDLYGQWEDSENMEDAARVRDFITSKLAELRLKRARDVCRDDAKTEMARKESVGHWGRMQKGTYLPEKESPGMTSCALCLLYNHSTGCVPVSPRNCCGCPISIRTGLAECEGGPYKNARDAWSSRNVTSSHYHEWVVNAQAMIDYLEEMDPQYLDEPKVTKHSHPLLDDMDDEVDEDDEDEPEEEQTPRLKRKLEPKPKSKRAKPAKLKGKKVLVPFRPHRLVKSVERWTEGESRCKECHLERYSVDQDGDLCYRGRNKWEDADEMEFRAPLDWPGPVPGWGRWVVPVVTGGPWRFEGKTWEEWRDGEYDGGHCGSGYRVHNGRLEYLDNYASPPTWNETFQHYSKQEIVGLVLHAPRGWTGPVPEGCCLLDERVPVERVSRKVMAQHVPVDDQGYFQPGTNLLILRGDGRGSMWSRAFKWGILNPYGHLHKARYAFLLDTDTYDHGPLDEERFFWAAGSEPKVKVERKGFNERCFLSTPAGDYTVPAQYHYSRWCLDTSADQVTVEASCDGKHWVEIDRMPMPGVPQSTANARRYEVYRMLHGAARSYAEGGDSLSKALKRMEEEDWGPRK